MKLMNKKVGTIFATLSLGASLSACAPSSKFDPSEGNRAARKAEGLMTEETFEDAYAEASRALAQDPSNARARLWKAALAPAMELRGIYTRIAPLANRTRERQERYAEAVAQLKASHGPRFVAFFTDGAFDITTERDAQEVVARVTARLDELRLTMKALRNQPMIIDGLPNARTVQLNTADFDALQQMIAGYQVYVSILNSYDLTGAWTASETTAHRSAQESVDLLLSNPKFGKLRDGRAFAVVPQLAKDAIVATRAALALQSELCPQGKPDPRNRPGTLFEEGLCIEAKDGFEATLKTIEAVASFNRLVVPLGEHRETHTVSAPYFFSNPIQDLRTIAPTSYDACGQVRTIADTTLGGLFPDGEVNSELVRNSRESCGN